ncbi:MULTISPECIES: carbon-nitrogen hydrolase family protein [unclassified Pseudomonas]|uniref:carbon-nitrogen hydrolase family protein n=1 Tax=unclassified Pseudomonas TaxID=196821 RepID=UPI002AC9AAE7|nr:MULTISPECIES: carbon-nitrogen hydrolase family protein [unclassified Pseudomonas]MEB0046670.1 carbon-nitrogen hydrolase family protein [Pseudomonas sp. Dout3]MEB0098552.1 carbon-nitrogen hydrolase family protein [Pseudomonas sp. DC1.2]WPX56673.1 carbon-nitrogen hydrolase family protein [Pseudomonas sp. DC1.2]
MTTLCIAAAQSISIAGNLEANIAWHQRFIQVAAEQGVQLLVFPELSLTGYERGCAAELAIAPDAEVLQPLRDFAREAGVTAVVGMPIRPSEHSPVLIGALVLGADGSLGVYSKQHLHSGEEVAFAPGVGGSTLGIGGDTVALAVCADFSHASHAAAAAEQGADVYAAGVLITENGYAPDTALLKGYASEHSMVVLMANHGGATGGWLSAGRSAIWAKGGALIAAAPGTGNLMVIGRRTGGDWEGQVVTVPEY